MNRYGYVLGLMLFITSMLPATLVQAETAPEPLAAVTASRPSTWSTSSHLGFAVADQSSTGFKAVGGSLALLDITAPLTPRLELGLRSIAEGGRGNEREFYRLGAGPLLSWRVSKAWVVQGTLAFFTETGLAGDGSRLYQSRGQEALIGWERVWTVVPRVEVAWGGFVGYHRGGLSAPSTAPAAATAAVATLNAGLSHGLEAAIRLSL